VNKLAVGIIVALGLCGFLRAESRESEDAMFGGAAPVSANAGAQSEPKAALTPTDADAQQLGAADPSRDAFASGENVDNPLQMGGIYYQQLIASPQAGQSEGETPISAPLQFDAFMDGRPNDRIRAYIDARLVYDPSKDAYSNSTSGSGAGGLSAGTIPSASGATTTALPNNPEVLLDQAWIKFDLAQALFFSVGKQHVKWGSSHIWNPTDFLTPQKLDPLQPYDLRLGSTMIKVEAPLKSAGTNLYAIALLDNPEPASTLQQVGGAFRAETVLWGAEIGLDAVTRSGLNPDYGADISAPLGPLDAYAEAAMLSGDSYSNDELAAVPSAGANVASLLRVQGLPGPVLQASAGANYSFAYMPNRQSTIGLEYFYNEIGADNGNIYPVLVYLGKYQPFYMGKNYAAIYISAEGLDSAKDTSYNFSTISNISDGSFVSRLDFSWLLLQHLTFGAYADAHYGTIGGEFNFALDTPSLSYGSSTIAPIHVARTPMDLGLSLRQEF
jgi:hypothetical protein